MAQKLIFTMLTYYTEDDDNNEVRKYDVVLPEGQHEVYLIDKQNEEKIIVRFTNLSITLYYKPNPVILIKTI